MKTTITINTAGKRTTAKISTYGRGVFNGESHNIIDLHIAKKMIANCPITCEGANFKTYAID